ncbi:MAG: rod shape-determining protein MreD [Acidimicrobiales bacterium]
MTFAKVGVVLVISIVLQISLFVDVRVAGVAPELLALVAVLAGFLAGPERGATVAFCAGLVWDVWLPTPLGLAAISFAIVAFAMGSIEAGLFHDSRLQVAGLAFLGTFAAVLSYALLGEVVGQRGLVDLELLRVASIAGLLNALIAPIMARPMRWALRTRTTFGAAAPTRS